MRVALDTNIVVSGLNFDGNERLVLELALRGRFDLYSSPFILEEVAEVLDRKFVGVKTAYPRLAGLWKRLLPSLNPRGSRV